MATPTVYLGRVSVLQEIVVRGCNVKAPGARTILQQNYEPDRVYTDVVGLSAVFREGASLDALATGLDAITAEDAHGWFRHAGYSSLAPAP